MIGRREFAALALAAGLAALLARPLPASAQAATEARIEDAAEHSLLVMLPLPPPHSRPDGSYAAPYGDGLGIAARRRVAARLARALGLTLESDWPMAPIGMHCFVMRLPDGAAAAPALEALSRDPDVAWAQPLQRFRARGHDDPLYPAQPVASAWQLAALHALANGRGQRVAVIDSAVDAAHPDLAGQVLSREDFVSAHPASGGEGHGTAVAGLVAARADNGIGIAGIAPGARLLALRACWQSDRDAATWCHSLSLALALQAALAAQADVINLSLGGPHDRLLDALLDAALARGTAVVAAADDSADGGGYPASHPGVIAVREQEAQGERLAPSPAFAAPGRDLPTTAPGGAMQVVSGASYAAAQVSGLVALLREARQASPATGRVREAASLLVRAPAGAIDACASLLQASGRTRVGLREAATRPSSAGTEACAPLAADRAAALPAPSRP